MATDYGTCIALAKSGPVGLDRSWRRVSGPVVVLHAVARRLCCPPGSLWWAPDVGFDLMGRLGEGFRVDDLPTLERLIEAEASRDERVISADASLSYDARTEKLRVDLVLVLAEGPFRLVLAASSATTELLLATAA